jgi:hypothetical protein
MRGSKVIGRFDMDYEAISMYEAMAEELGGKVGIEVDWFRWQDWYLEDADNNVVDDIYDVSSAVEGGGRRWMAPFKMPTIAAQMVRGGNQMNERGFYTTDTLRLVINAGELKNRIPEILRNEPNQSIKDRILYRGQVFTPTRINPRGAFGFRWAVVTIDCNEVNSEELVNDPQFLRYASPTPIGYGAGSYGSNSYGG